MDWRLYHWINTFQQNTTWANGPLRLYAKDGIVVFPLAIIVAWWGLRGIGAKTAEIYVTNKG